MHPAELTTARLRLRSWCDSDLAPFAALNADPRVMEYFPKLLTREESDAQAARFRSHFELHGYGLWAVEVTNGAPFIGFVGLSHPSFEAHFTPCVEIGWRLAFEHWGHGYATEAAKAALAFAFQDLRLDEVLSFTFEGNYRSRRVMHAIGMSLDADGAFDHPKLVQGHPLRPHVLYRVQRSSK